MKEIWKTIEGYPDYEVSNFGGIRSWRKPSWRSKRRKEPIILKCSHNGVGYKNVQLRIGNIVTPFKTVHRLVIKHFGGAQPENKPLALHNDGNKLNNHISNLRWGSYTDNAFDKIKHNGPPIRLRGQRINRYEAIAIKIFLRKGLFQKRIAKLFDVTENLICLINIGRIWRTV